MPPTTRGATRRGGAEKEKDGPAAPAIAAPPPARVPSKRGGPAPAPRNEPADERASGAQEAPGEPVSAAALLLEVMANLGTYGSPPFPPPPRAALARPEALTPDPPQRAPRACAR